MKYTSAYITGALTVTSNTHDVRALYESVGAFCSSKNLITFVPHLKADPQKYPHMTPREVWEWNLRGVLAADVVIAYVGMPSTGTGAEIEIARMAGKDVIIWSFVGEIVTRFIQGNPAVQYNLIVKDIQELEQKLEAIFLTTA
ncbi:MAG: hypothetical protein RI911_160 [Candidatus Parcubacteria bacterium]|jgi:nucleoside 2-deoxyribosyltransferase